MVEPETVAPPVGHVIHAFGFFGGAAIMAFLTWLQIELIGPRWDSLSLILALIVSLFLIQGVRHLRIALRAASNEHR